MEQQNINYWELLKSHFECDGSLRDIYVFEADAALWDLFIAQILSHFHPQFWHGSEKGKILLNFKSVLHFRDRGLATTMRFFLVGNIEVNCHFFEDDKIEMDIAPEEIHNETAFNTLLSFLSWLSDALHRTTHLTYENSPEWIILSMGRNEIKKPKYNL